MRRGRQLERRGRRVRVQVVEDLGDRRCCARLPVASLGDGDGDHVLGCPAHRAEPDKPGVRRTPCPCCRGCGRAGLPRDHIRARHFRVLLKRPVGGPLRCVGGADEPLEHRLVVRGCERDVSGHLGLDPLDDPAIRRDDSTDDLGLVTDPVIGERRVRHRLFDGRDHGFALAERHLDVCPGVPGGVRVVLRCELVELLAQPLAVHAALHLSG